MEHITITFVGCQPPRDSVLRLLSFVTETAFLAELERSGPRRHCYYDAANLFRQLVEAPTFPEFLTLPAYDLITTDLA
jgi:hypothetical protein